MNERKVNNETESEPVISRIHSERLNPNQYGKGIDQVMTYHHATSLSHILYMPATVPQCSVVISWGRLKGRPFANRLPR